MSIKCLGEGCSWSLYAAKIVDEEENPFFRINTMNSQHSCFGVLRLGHRQATATLLSTQIQAKLRDSPSYRPKDIQQDIRHEHGLQITYMQAYHVKEQVIEAINGNEEDAYAAMPKYCEALKRNNPNSIIMLECTPEENGNRFHHTFIYYSASATGFGYCRPILSLDGTHLKSKYHGVLLTATTIDANESLFPLAYTIVSVENDDNWFWFIQLLHSAIEQHAPTFLAP